MNDRIACFQDFLQVWDNLNFNTKIETKMVPHTNNVLFHLNKHLACITSCYKEFYSLTSR